MFILIEIETNANCQQMCFTGFMLALNYFSLFSAKKRFIIWKITYIL